VLSPLLEQSQLAGVAQLHREEQSRQLETLLSQVQETLQIPVQQLPHQLAMFKSQPVEVQQQWCQAMLKPRLDLSPSTLAVLTREQEH
jgi:hypothetical protein